MQASNIPVKVSVPFANSATAGYIRTVPVASQIGIQDGAASYHDGFPPLTFIPIGSGGVPPFGQDVNGILNEITQWTQWLNAGGTVPYDAAFSAAIGGYPAGALLLNVAGNGFWLCTADNNTNNPDTTPTGWIPIVTIASTIEPKFNGAAAAGTATPYSREDHVHPNDWGGVSTGAANAQIVAAPNGLVALNDGVTLTFAVGLTLTNTGPATLQVGTGPGALGPLPIVKDTVAGPVALVGGELFVGNVIAVEVQNGQFHLRSPALGSAAAANASSATGKVAALTGTFATGNLPVFSATTGTLQDSGTSPGSLAGSAEGVLFQLGQLF